MQAYFSVLYGASTDDFTVLVGTTFDNFAPLYEEVTGWNLEYISGAWVQSPKMGVLLWC